MNAPEQAEWLAFLSAQRVTLFNTRRDHEWKVVFGVLTLIGAVDFALLTHPLVLAVRWHVHVWRALLVLLFIGHAGYQWGVQRRNRIDRIVVDALNKKICDLVGLDQDSPARIPVDRTSPRDVHKGPAPTLHPTYLWAYYWQIVIVLIACSVSAMLPLVGAEEQHKPCVVRSSAEPAGAA